LVFLNRVGCSLAAYESANKQVTRRGFDRSCLSPNFGVSSAGRRREAKWGGETLESRAKNNPQKSESPRSRAARHQKSKLSCSWCWYL